VDRHALDSRVRGKDGNGEVDAEDGAGAWTIRGISRGGWTATRETIVYAVDAGRRHGAGGSITVKRFAAVCDYFFGASMVPRQFLLPHQQAYSAFSFLVWRSSITNP